MFELIAIAVVVASIVGLIAQRNSVQNRIERLEQKVQTLRDDRDELFRRMHRIDGE